MGQAFASDRDAFLLFVALTSIYYYSTSCSEKEEAEAAEREKFLKSRAGRRVAALEAEKVSLFPVLQA